ncbi:MAG: glucuronate isomerase, partial [Saprospiraceae bacterium]|nr:glucuronate isomerase [Saprospiraceae bacterium]
MAGTHNQRTFLDDHFLLDNEIAVELFHAYAKEQPIIDYHSHLPPEDIAQNRQFENLTQIWLNGDHYKWRAMRTLGIEEQYITGGATDQDKFLAWAKTVPYTMRNPLFHWTHLELKRYFDIETLLNPKTAVTIFAEANELLGTDPYRTQGLLQKMKVEVVCTTDDPVDDLDSHRQMAANEGAPIRVLPTFRPDKAIQIMQDHFPDYITTLGEAAHIEIAGLDDLFEALSKRVAYFADHGCALSDHGLEHIPFTAYTHKEVDVIFKRRLQGQALDTRENAQFQTALLVFLGTLYAEKNWTMQLHLGAMRNNSQRMKRTLGPDTGFDSSGDYPQAVGLSRFLDQLDEQDTLPKTIVYNLNPRDNEVMATL